MLFIYGATNFGPNKAFQVKMAFLVLAGLNALAFHYGIGKRLVDWDVRPLPQTAHWVGTASITLWVLIVFCGRLIAYNWFAPLV